MRILAAGGSFPGKVRKNNQDNLLFDGEILPEKHDEFFVKGVVGFSEPAFFAGVFDGMGGHECGERASYLTAQTAQRYADALPEAKFISKFLTQICLEANDVVCADSEDIQMGTTAAMLCISEKKYYLCNIGDSPVFLLRNGRLQQISEDHNGRAMYERVTGRKADPKQKFKLTQCIGISRKEIQIEPYTCEGTVMDGDTFLLCSDGVTDMLNADTIRNILLEPIAPQGMVMRLIDMSMAAGGRDNITAICLKISQEERITVWSWLRNKFGREAC